MEHVVLNDRQRVTIDELDKNILLLASAGTGKTNTLAYRLANIIEKERAKPWEILCLTFTNRACREMRERVISILGQSAFAVTIKTFHSFCYGIIKSEAKRQTDLLADFIVFDEEDCREIIAELNDEGFRTGSLQGFIDFIKEQSIVFTHKDYQRIILEMNQKNRKRLTAFCIDERYRFDNRMYQYLLSKGGEFINEYNRSLIEQNALDFTDLLILVSDLLNDAEVLERWNKKFKYIHIDEIQDTSEIEYNIVSKLFSGNNIMLSGDYFQTIYEWRGSNPENVFNLFKQDFDPVTIIFNRNYRATKKLLQASYAYLENTFPVGFKREYYADVIADSSVEGEKILLKKASSPEDEANWIFQQIKNLETDDVSKVAILTRSNNYNNNLSKCLERINKTLPEEEQLEFMLVEEYKFFRRQEIKDILAYLKLLVNSHDVNSFKRILLRFAKGIGQRTIDKLETEELKQIGIRLTDFLDKNVFSYGDPYYPLIRELDGGNVILFDVESTGLDTANDEIVQIAAVKINKKGEILEEFKEFIKPTKAVGSSQYIHGFSDAFLKEKGRDGRVVLAEFSSFLKGALVGGHNVNYDLNLLLSQLNRLNLPSPKYLGSFDTLEMARRFYPQLKNHKLDYLAQYFETKTKPSHDAIFDTLATAEILLQLVETKVRPLMKERMKTYEAFGSTFEEFSNTIRELREKTNVLRPYELVNEVIEVSKIKTIYQGEIKRLGYIDEFCHLSKAIEEPEMSPRDGLIELLKITALSNSELDRIMEKYPKTPIITIHQAKGAEFDYVFLAGLQEYIFPSYPAIKDDQLDEEKRLFYVAITRAKKQLFLSWPQWSKNRIREGSRFINNLPQVYLEHV